jgi:predicted phage gp36 major capsid-like protein
VSAGQSDRRETAKEKIKREREDVRGGEVEAVRGKEGELKKEGKIRRKMNRNGKRLIY